jgi:alanyl-tRNA synthetase
MEHKYIIADHLRTICFLVSDGILPAGKGRGYILRRLLRRVLRSSLALKIDINSEAYYLDLVKAVAKIYENVYTLESEVLDKTKTLLLQEAQKYQKAIATGEKEWLKILKSEELDQDKLVKNTFNLYQSHGVPLELSESILEKNNLVLDLSLLNEQISNHQEISNTTKKGEFKSGLIGNSPKTMALHTLTHIMHQKLRDLYSTDEVEVRQMGSSITDEKARFDFSCEQEVDIKLLQFQMNEIVELGLEMKVTEMNPDDAKKEGAIGLFGDKYGAKVNIYTLCDKEGKVYSKEFCNGPHVSNTSEIKEVIILKQKSLGSGVKRIEFDVIMV